MAKRKKISIEPQTPNSHSEHEIIPEDAISLLHSIANTPATRSKPRVGDASPNLGVIPLWPNTKDSNSADLAYKKTLELLKAEKVETTELDWLRQKLVTIAQRYWVEHERDTRATPSDMKNEVARLQRDLGKVITRLGELPMATRQALNAGVRSQLPKRNGPSPNYVAELHERSVLLHGACEPISSKTNTKVRRSIRFERCAADLWALREKITGKPISKVFDLHQENSFTTKDAHFIHAVMTAIDEDVEGPQVQDGLRRAAKAKKEKKIAPRKRQR